MPRPCLYRHFNAAGELLYVGIANSIFARINGHRAKSGWLDEITRVEIEWFATRAEAHEAERAAIRAENPRHNRVRYPIKVKPVREPRQPTEEADRKAKHRRLVEAGWTFQPGGWLPEKNPAGRAFQAQLDAYREDMERLLSEPAAPRGRSRKP